MHWDISLVRFYEIQCHCKGSCIFYLYPGDEKNKQKFSQSRVTSANVHKNTMRYWCELIPADSFLGHYIKGIKYFLTDAVNILLLLNF